MGFSESEGYIPLKIEEILIEIMEGVNDIFGTSYTYETFVGTNFYKFSYVLAQKIQKNEVKLAEIFLKLQDFLRFTEEKINAKKTTHDGLLLAFEEAGYVASIKKMIKDDRGLINVCVNVDDNDDDYAAMKIEICTILKDYTIGGIVSQGTEEETLTLTNGQAFDFKFHLPDRKETDLKLTITTSRNNQHLIDHPDVIKGKLLTNIADRYRLGKDFEPEIYFTFEDAPYAGDIKLEYSFDSGSNWETEVFKSGFDDLVEVDLSRITLIQE